MPEPIESSLDRVCVIKMALKAVISVVAQQDQAWSHQYCFSYICLLLKLYVKHHNGSRHGQDQSDEDTLVLHDAYANLITLWYNCTYPEGSQTTEHQKGSEYLKQAGTLADLLSSVAVELMKREGNAQNEDEALDQYAKRLSVPAVEGILFYCLDEHAEGEKGPG